MGLSSVGPLSGAGAVATVSPTAGAGGVPAGGGGDGVASRVASWSESGEEAALVGGGAAALSVLAGGALSSPAGTLGASSSVTGQGG